MPDLSHLDRAMRAEAWIDSARIETRAGITWMQAAASVGSYLLRLHAVAKGRVPGKIHFPDSPFATL